jgi:hypothetical protein
MLMISLASASQAGPEQVALPSDYANSFIHYKTLDKRDQDPDVVRQIYIDPPSADLAQLGAPLPEGTRLVMVDHLAAVNAGETLRDRGGRMVPSDEIKQILVAEKRAGFGAEYGDDLRTGDWEFAVFLSDGSRKPGVNFDRCRECHLQAKSFDFTFSVFPNLDAIKR